MTDNLTNDIRDLNLSYLMLAQSMIRNDKPQALYRLGIGEDTADLVAQMSPQQMLRIASRSQLLCAMRFGQELIWALLSDSHAPASGGSADRLHASVLMAGQRAAAVAAA